MKMTLAQAFDMFNHKETPEEWQKRMARIRRLANERDALKDAIEVLGGDPRQAKKIERLAKVQAMLERLV